MVSNQRSLASRRGGARSLDRFVVQAVLLSLASLLVGGKALLASDLLRGSALDRPQAADTSFGAVIVNGADILDGLTAQDLGGVTHGISGLVLSDKAQAQLSITLQNTSDAPVPYNPELFRLREGENGTPIAPTGSAHAEGVVPPGTSIDLLLDFVVLRTGEELYLEFSDLGSTEPVVVRIGPTDLAPTQNDGGSHGH